MIIEYWESIPQIMLEVETVVIIRLVFFFLLSVFICN